MFGFAKVVACRYFGHQTNRIRHSRGEREEEPERRRTVGALLQQPGGGPCQAGHGTDDRPAPPCVEWPLFMHARVGICLYASGVHQGPVPLLDLHRAYGSCP
jgi:hypothetical protein